MRLTGSIIDGYTNQNTPNLGNQGGARWNMEVMPAKNRKHLGQSTKRTWPSVVRHSQLHIRQHSLGLIPAYNAYHVSLTDGEAT